MTEAKQAMLFEAQRKAEAARQAGREGNQALRDVFLQQAADRYRAVGFTILARQYESWIGR